MEGVLIFLTINTDCQPFIYYSDPGAGPPHINCPSVEEEEEGTPSTCYIICLYRMKDITNYYLLALQSTSEKLKNK
jgi:hypothetical protein